jgi:hypothetical protein
VRSRPNRGFPHFPALRCHPINLIRMNSQELLAFFDSKGSRARSARKDRFIGIIS